MLKKRRKIRIQCKCRLCGKVWMDRKQLDVCADCERERTRRAEKAAYEAAKVADGNKQLN